MKKIIFLALVLPGLVKAGAFVFAGEANGVDIITHPKGYNGNGTTLNINVCINPSGTETTDLEVAVKNIVDTWNGLHIVEDNLRTDDDMQFSQYDWESVVLHEVGHCIGLAHPNLGSRSGVAGDNTNYTNTTDGADDIFRFDDGTDNIIGSADDIRGDDINLHWFNSGVNDPFVISPPFDASQYSRDLASLPQNDNFVANADRDVGSDLGYRDVEAVMQQGTFNNEAQRHLAVDDVATLRLAMSGLNVVEGNADDYRYKLSYGGIASNCDINITHKVDPTFAFCSIGGAFIGGGHIAITTAEITVGDSYNWFFNQKRNDLIFRNGVQQYD